MEDELLKRGLSKTQLLLKNEKERGKRRAFLYTNCVITITKAPRKNFEGENRVDDIKPANLMLSCRPGSQSSKEMSPARSNLFSFQGKRM